MDDLRAQARNDRRRMRLEGVHDALDHGSVAGIGDIHQHRPRLGHLADIPEQVAAGGRMEEAAQCPTKPGEEDAEIAILRR